MNPDRLHPTSTVFVKGLDGEPPALVETPRPTDDEIKKLVEIVAARVIRLLVRRGLLDENSCALDPLVEKEPVLAELLRRVFRRRFP